MATAFLPFPDIGPALFTIEVFGISLSLRWYALAYIAGLLIALWIVKRLLRRPTLWPGDTAPMQADSADDLLTWMIIGVIVGGRLGFVLFYNLDYYLAHPIEIPMIWQGGMSFHGGFLGVIAATILFSWRRGVDMIRVGDAVAVSAPPGIFLGRLSNFINGELWGRGTDVPWAMVFPDPRSLSCAFWGDQPCARHPSQLYEALGEGLILFLVMLWGIRRGWLKTPGRMIGTFLLGYGLARYVVEFFRQPDAQFQSADNPIGFAYRFGDFGLTMGQTLCLPMIALGLAIFFWPRRA